MKLAELKNLLSFLKGKKVAVLGHRHADIDALVSAYVMKRECEKAGAKANILVYDGLNYDAENLSREYNIKFLEVNSKEELFKYDEIIVVDTHSIEQIEIMEGVKAYAVIDHHEKSATLIDSKNYFIRPDAVANAQHILWLLDLDKEEKELIAIAFISDTFRFKRFDKRAAKEFSTLLNEVEKDYNELLKLAFPNRKKSSKLAILNSLKRSKYVEEGNYIISYTITEDNTGEVAGLLTTFSDIAIVMKNNNGKSNMSLRANEFFPFELNKMAEKIAKNFKGAGGGHKKAAGASLPVKAEDAIEKVVEMVKTEIKANEI